LIGPRLFCNPSRRTLSLEIAGDRDFEYRFTNCSSKSLKAVFSFHSANFMKVAEGARITAMQRGFVLEQPPSSAHSLEVIPRPLRNFMPLTFLRKNLHVRTH